MAVICVRSGTVLWSTAHDKHSHSSAPWGKLVTLNHTAIVYITLCQLGLRPMLHVRDILTGEIKATKPIPDDLFLLSSALLSPFTDGISLQLHPRRDLVYIAARRKASFFSTTTANCVGRLSAARVSLRDLNSSNQDSPLRFHFSEHQPKCSPSAREKFFLYQYNQRLGFQSHYCFEYEIPTDEDISISEARILQDADQGSKRNLISKVVRIQIYGRCIWGLMRPLRLNPMLKQLAHAELNQVRGNEYMQVRLRSFTGHYPLPENTYDISLEPEKPHDSSIPIEFYPHSSRDVLVTKPKKVLGRAREHHERADCLLPKALAVPITLTERYMFLTHQSDVYLFAYEPEW